MKRFRLDLQSQTVLSLIIAFSCFTYLTVAQTSVNAVSCSSNKSDAFCNTNSNINLGDMCCATVIQSVKGSGTTVTNTTNYECLPVDFVNHVGVYQLSATTNYTYKCESTTKTGSTYCSGASDSACASPTFCCAARGAAVSTGQVNAFSQSVCYN